jgi:hypothetical protein
MYRLGSSGFKARIALAVASLWVLVGTCLALRHHPATPSRMEASDGILLELEPGSPYAGIHPRAEIVSDFSKLPPLPDGATIVAASHFEPSGAQFPKGMRVTWPLAAEREPGSILWIVNLDPDTQKWIDTGKKAIVGDSGRLATGTIFHFSDKALTTGECKKE